ncbi:MAG: polysaccharide biosynthesis C-terminal domain-containing protein [Flavobacteriaceae bacterium]
MGIVRKQSFSNMLITYTGFVFGAVNTLFLYTNLMSDEHYGLINFILSAAMVLMPLMAFGVHNAMVKFYNRFVGTPDENAFLTLMLLLPLGLIIPLTLWVHITYDAIAQFLSRQNEIVGNYVWHIVLVGVAMAYFEIFYAWARVHLKSVFGNFMKELFCRVGVAILLVLLYFKIIDVPAFINLLVGIYLLRTIVMKLYAYAIKRPVLTFAFPGNSKEIFTYSALLIIGGSVATILLEIDKVMINNFIPLENVAFYSVASFMAIAIAVPARAMHQITYPLTAKLLTQGTGQELKVLYQKSSLTLFIASGILFLLILLNLHDIYLLIPETYSAGFTIVFWIGLAKVYDSLLGNNNSILYNSKYYKTVLLFGVFLAMLTIALNLWLIPKFGLKGAAIASFMAFAIYNSMKLWYVHKKFHIHPFTKETFKVLSLLALVAILFFPLQFPFHPLVNIVLKGLLMAAMYLGLLYRFKISEDVMGLLSKFLKR